MESESQLPQQDPSGVMIEGEGEHHPHKSVLKKVKDKAKKIKGTIKKHNHDHDGGHVDDELEDMVDDPERAPMYDSTVIRTTNVPMESNINVACPKRTPAHDQDENKIAPAGLVETSPSNYRSKVTDPTADAGANVAPLLSQFDNMDINKILETRSGPESDGQEKPVKTEYTPTQNTIAEKISSANNAGGPHVEGQDHSSEQQLIGVKEYLGEKLRPGDEDRALSEVITEVLTWRRERSVVEGKKREGEAESSGQGVVGRLKDAVGAWLGKGTGLQTVHDSIEGTCVIDPIPVGKGEGASGRG